MSTDESPDGAGRTAAGPELGDLRANRSFDSSLRLAIANELGESGFEHRDRYDAFGWETDPSEEEYVGLYLRNPYAQAVIDKPVATTWREDPKVEDLADGDSETAFEEAAAKAARNLDAYSYLSRVDRAAGFGEFALLFIDFADVDDLDSLDEPVDIANGSLDDIRGFRVIPQFAVDDIDRGDFGSDRWGEPEFYSIDWSEEIDEGPGESEADASKVHHSRVVEAPSKPPLADEYSSRSRLEPLLNTLYDIEKGVGATAEAAFRGVDKGLHINYDPTKVDPSAVDDDGTKSDIREWYHGLQPTLNTVGAEVNDLGGEIQDPSGFLDTKLKDISAVTGFPKQIIEGSAAGELASAEENKRQWFGVISERQTQYAAPMLVRRFFGTLMDAGVMPLPEGGGYDIHWPDLFELSEEEEATIEQKRSQTAKNLGVMGEPAQTYVESGEFPADDRAPAMPAIDESNPAVVQQFDRQNGVGTTDNAEDDVDRTPPKQARENAQTVLRWREEHPDEIEGMTEVGWRRARQLADGGELSADVIKKMAQFNRHRENAEVAEEHKGTPWKDAGHVAWLGWGGDAGVNWAIRQSEKLTDNATRYEQGDTVSTPQGVGVVTAVATEAIESEDVDETIEASEDSPTYMVVVEDARVGAEFYKASEIHATDIQTDMDDPVGALAEDQSANGVVGAILDTLTANGFSPPRSWRRSNTPARIIALKAFASMGGSFDGCVREMRGTVSSPDRFCGSFVDYLVGNKFWRGDSPLPGD